jgi:hypothetical protein
MEKVGLKIFLRKTDLSAEKSHEILNPEMGRSYITGAIIPLCITYVLI